MKLMTDCPGCIAGSNDDFAHDAAMAHALVTAIIEMQTMSEMLVTIRIRKRADELMAQWGCTED